MCVSHALEYFREWKEQRAGSSSGEQGGDLAHLQGQGLKKVGEKQRKKETPLERAAGGFSYGKRMKKMFRKLFEALGDFADDMS